MIVELTLNVAIRNPLSVDSSLTKSIRCTEGRMRVSTNGVLCQVTPGSTATVPWGNILLYKEAFAESPKPIPREDEPTIEAKLPSKAAAQPVAPIVRRGPGRPPSK